MPPSHTQGVFGAAVGAGAAARPTSWAVPWTAVDGLLDRLDIASTCDHGLGPLAAYRRRSLGQDVPEQLRREERAAATANLVAPTLLARARDAITGPLVVLKGPEIAVRYPGRARRFGDLDLLPTDAEAAQAALLAAGFRLQDRDWPPEGYDDERNPHYHLHPLEWPGLALRIEVHKHVKWPAGFEAPPNEEIFEAAVPSSTDIDGLLAPEPRPPRRPARDARVGRDPDAAHSRAHGRPGLRRRRRPGRARAHGRALGLPARLGDDAERRRLALLREGPEPVAVRLWARYLRGLREPTVIEMHVQEWLAPFWMAPPGRAARRALAAIARDFRPAPEQTWAEKGRGTLSAVLHPLSPRSEHDRRYGRGRRGRVG